MVYPSPTNLIYDNISVRAFPRNFSEKRFVWGYNVRVLLMGGVGARIDTLFQSHRISPKASLYSFFSQSNVVLRSKVTETRLQ